MTLRSPLLWSLLAVAALAVTAAQGTEPAAAVGSPPDAEVVGPPLDNPHGRSDSCASCHDDVTPDGMVGSPRPTVESCRSCHADADMHPVNVAPNEVKVPDGWPLEDGKLVCSTCHAEPSCDAERSRTVPWFRGGPVVQTKDFCFRCHDAAGYEREDPHHPVAEEDGTCSACHSGKPRTDASVVDSRLRVSADRICGECHEAPIHRGVLSHLGVVVPPERAALLPASIPLDDSGTIHCWTCHDVHRHAEATKPKLSPRDARVSRALKDLVRAGHPTRARSDPAHPPLLALPLDDNALCSACHGGGG